MSDDQHPGDNPAGSDVPGDGGQPTQGGDPYGPGGTGGQDHPTQPLWQQPGPGQGQPPADQGFGQDQPTQQLWQQPGQMPGQPPPGQGSGGYVQGQPGQYPQGQPGQYPQGQPGGQYPPGQPGPYAPAQPGQYPPGQQQGYQQPYGQQGWDQQPYGQQGWGGQGEPPKKSNTGMIVAIVAIVVAVILIGVTWLVLSGRSDDATPSVAPSTTAAETTEPSEPVEPTPEPEEPSTDPMEPSEPNTQPTEPDETNGQEPPAGDLPVMPSQVGEFETVLDPEPEFAAWTGPGAMTYTATWTDLLGKDQFASQLENPEEFGDWLCGSLAGAEMSQCVAEAYDGTVLLVGNGSAADMAAFGDEFLAAWK